MKSCSDFPVTRNDSETRACPISNKPISTAHLPDFVQNVSELELPETKAFSAPSFFSFANVGADDKFETQSLLSVVSRSYPDSEDSGQTSKSSTPVQPREAKSCSEVAPKNDGAYKFLSRPPTNSETQEVKEALYAIWTNGEQSKKVPGPLSELNQLIFNCILERKNFSLTYTQLMSAEYSPPIRNSKRLEEKMKFVFKRVFKKLVLNMTKADKRIRKTDKQNLSLVLFEKYYGEISKQTTIPLERFMIPQTVKSDFNLKTFSAEYLKLLKMSPDFVAHFTEHMAKVEKDSIADIRGKIDKLVDKINEKLRNSPHPTTSLSCFGSECRSKLPWTEQEITDAFAEVRNHLKP